MREKDNKLHKALCKILKEMMRADPASGLGKPEPLKHNLSGLWSKRISQKDRLIYKFDNEYNALPRGKCERCWASPSEYLFQPRFLQRT
jgi:Txe/YoeB family toxin of toxin-antitoxin system